MSDPRDPGQDSWQGRRYQFKDWQGTSDPWGAPEEQASVPAQASVYVECWRCGKLGFKDLDACIYCRAPLNRGAPLRRETRRMRDSEDSTKLVKVLVVFIGLLASLVIFVVLQTHEPEGLGEGQLTRRVLNQLLLFGLIDALLVGLAWAWVGLPARLPPQSTVVRGVTWATAAPVLLLSLGLNYLYQLWLRNSLNLPVIEPDFKANKELLPWAILAICVLPAVVEELFFRYLALNALRPAAGTNGAVLISAVMFGMAHIGNPLGIPYLIVLGVVLGYVRVGSGNLVLPMLMHFGHNLAVLFIQ